MEHEWIAICDDQVECAKSLSDIVTDICLRHNIEIRIKTFENGSELLKDLEGCLVAFLDIDMPLMDGIELGKRITEINFNCKLIMATGKTERYKDAFKIQAHRFVTKPFDITEIEEALITCIINRIQNEKVSVYKNRVLYELRQSEIYYLMAYNSYVEVKTADDIFRKDSSLDSFSKELDNRLFVRIHKAYVINLQWVKEIRKNSVLVGREELPVSRRCKKEFEQKYIEFDLRYR